MTDDTAQRLRANRRRRAVATAKIEQIDAELRELILQALDEGTGPTELAEITGLTRARVYQIRDGRR